LDSSLESSYYPSLDSSFDSSKMDD